MKLKELNPKYEDLELYKGSDNFGLLEIPQNMKYDFALSLYSERKVLFFEYHEDKKTTEVLIEGDIDFHKRQNLMD